MTPRQLDSLAPYVSDAQARRLLAPDERLIFIRGGWCEHYDSRYDEAWPQGGGTHNDVYQGAECDNFRPYRGFYYAYVRARHNQPLTLARLGGGHHADSVRGVTVVQVATHPDEGGQVVVGWFRSAIAYATWEHRPFPPGTVCCFKAPVNLAVCLPESERTIPIPKGKQGAMGQSQVRYASDPEGRLRISRWMLPALEAIQEHEARRRPRRSADT